MFFPIQKGLLNFVVIKARRLGLSLDYWDEIGVNKTIGEVISEGCKIPIISTPSFFFSKQ